MYGVTSNLNTACKIPWTKLIKFGRIDPWAYKFCCCCFSVISAPLLTKVKVGAIFFSVILNFVNFKSSNVNS